MVDACGNAMPSTTIPHWFSPDDLPFTIVEGNGTTIVDDEGNEYLDFLSQLYCVNAGHGDQRIIEAIVQQAYRIQYVSPSMANDQRDALADRLVNLAPDELTSLLFSITGSEANELAVQLAREVQDAPTVLTRWRSYHGSTVGAGSMTGDPGTRNSIERYAPSTNVARFLPPLPHRAPFPAETPEELAKQAGDHLEYVIRNEGPESVAAILIEPIGGTSGAYPAPPGYFKRVRELCDTYDILLISDEVITGFGRCGDWFGISTEGVVPDMITFAKGVTSGYLPLGGVLVNRRIASHLFESGHPLGQTFAGNPIACAAANAAIERYDSDLIEHGQTISPVLESSLLEISESNESIGSVHGRGMLWSVEFTDPETGAPFVDPWTEDRENPVARVRSIAQETGVLFGTGRPDVQIIVAPPLSVTESEVEKAIEVLDVAIEKVFG